LNTRSSANRYSGQEEIRQLADIPGLPFHSFKDLQDAASEKKINVGVDPLAAARWSDQYSAPAIRLLITSLSVLLVLAGLSAVVLALSTHSYWILAALPAMAAAFYFSNPSSEYRKWITIAGAASVAVFLDLVVNGLLTAALIVAYAGLTFAAVRAAAFVANSSFRKAILKDERSFIQAYCNSECSIKDDETKRVYSFKRWR
jgi:hypothetical protein